MLTFLMLALLSWTCSQSSQGKDAGKVNQEKPPIKVDYSDEEVELAPASTLGQEAEEVARSKTGERPITRPNSASKVVIKMAEEVVVNEEMGHGSKGLGNEEMQEDKDEIPADATETLGSVDHSSFSELLGKHVDAQGKVNYAGLKNDLVKLESYLAQLKDQPVEDTWSSSEKLAYWINTYNAFTIKLILDNYPVSSITDLEGGKPWDKKWIELGDKTYSLNQIENDIIRPQFKEPRIHFAVNCAAKSCPPLANRAFTAANLDGLLESQTKKFINNTVYNKLTVSHAQVSKIFDWYGSDFGNLIIFLNKYSTVKINDNAKLEFVEYNWSLNN